MPAIDAFTTNPERLSDPVEEMVTVTPHDSNELVSVTRGLVANAAGLVKLVPYRQSAAVTVYMLAGVAYPYRVKQVWDTGTDSAVKTAGIVGLY